VHESLGILVGDALGALEFCGFAMNEQTTSESPPTGPTVPTLPPQPATPVEIGGRKGPEPTRYGDWEKDGRCIDF
jgi:hypothetical protein